MLIHLLQMDGKEMKQENSIKKLIMKWKVRTGLDSTKQVRTSYNQEKIIRSFKNFCQQSI